MGNSEKTASGSAESRIQDGQDVWYAVDDERYAVTPFTKERLQEILMDLMS